MKSWPEPARVLLAIVPNDTFQLNLEKIHEDVCYPTVVAV